jgi:prophage antirepressor-like protein
MSTQIAVNGWNLVSSDDFEGHWMTGEEIGKHLGYSEPRKSVNNIYERHKDSFKKAIDVSDISLVTEAGPRTTRVFSERGTLKVIRYSNTEVADKVMEEVSDLYLAVRKISSSGKACVEFPEVKAAKMCAQLMSTAMKIGMTRTQAREATIEKVKSLTGVDLAVTFKLEENSVFASKAELSSKKEKEDFIRLLEVWYQCFEDEFITLKKVRLHLSDSLTDKASDLKEAITALDLRGKFNFRKLGYYLRKNKGRIGEQYKFAAGKNLSSGIEWQVIKLTDD